MCSVMSTSLNQDEIFCACLEGGISLAEAFAVFFQTLHRFLIF